MITMRARRIRITRSVDWKRVVSVKFDGAAFSKEDLISQLADGSSQSLPKEDETIPYLPQRLVVAERPAVQIPTATSQTSRAFAVNLLQEISVDASPVSSHGRVDLDSLVIQLVGRDSNGQPASLRGTLQATLWGVTRQLVALNPNGILSESPGRRQRVVTASPAGVLRLATWTRSVETVDSPFLLADQYEAQGRVASPARFVLPLPRPLPDHNMDLSPFGHLHIKLVVPGQGVFETTQSGVPLRDMSPFRAYFLSQIGSRFLPQEGTSDGRRTESIPFKTSPFSRQSHLLFAP